MTGSDAFSADFITGTYGRHNAFFIRGVPGILLHIARLKVAGPGVFRILDEKRAVCCRAGQYSALPQGVPRTTHMLSLCDSGKDIPGFQNLSTPRKGFPQKFTEPQ